MVTADTIVNEIGYDDVKIAYLLAFKAQEDNRPLYVESALLATELTNNHWRLTHAFRHPKKPASHSRQWSVSLVMDSYHIGSRDFETRPTGTDVEDFLRDTWWEFEARGSFRLISGEVYGEAWEDALGYKPKHDFKK